LEGQEALDSLEGKTSPARTLQMSRVRAVTRGPPVHVGSARTKERRPMAQFLTLVSLLAISSYAVWHYREALFHRGPVRVAIRLDREAPGAHLIWSITNVGPAPITITKLVIHARQGAIDVPLTWPKALAPQDDVQLPTDVDWSVLSARSIAAVDAAGREHPASRRELARIQYHLRQHIDLPAPSASARDFLSGAADFAFGMVILGLGFFMLMWVIATA
jgi:hypothetical protein